MKRKLSAVIAVATALSGWLVLHVPAQAGCLHCKGLRTQQSSCGCGSHGHLSAHSQHFALSGGCGCAAVAAGCCGPGMGLAQAGNLYGMQAMPLYSADFPFAAPDAFPLGSQMTGYEGLPNMDGGGVHERLPYHSYRRPWFHPGPASKNVTIVW